MLRKFKKNLGMGIAAALLVVNFGAALPARAAGVSEEINQINRGIERDLKRAGFHEKAYHFTMTPSGSDSPVIKDLIEKHERLQDEVEGLREDQIEIAERVKELKLQIQVQQELKDELEKERKSKGFFKEAKERRKIHKREDEASADVKNLNRELADELKKMKNIASKINVKTSEYLAVRQTLAKHRSAGKVVVSRSERGAVSSRVGRFEAHFEGGVGGGRRRPVDAGRGRARPGEFRRGELRGELRDELRDEFGDDFDDSQSFEEESFEFEGHSEQRMSGRHRVEARPGRRLGARQDGREDGHFEDEGVEHNGRGGRRVRWADEDGGDLESRHEIPGRRQNARPGNRPGHHSHFNFADLEVEMDQDWMTQKRQRPSNGGETRNGRKIVDADVGPELVNHFHWGRIGLNQIAAELDYHHQMAGRLALTPEQAAEMKHWGQYEEFLFNANRIARDYFADGAGKHFESLDQRRDSAKLLNEFYKDIFAYGTALEHRNSEDRDQLLKKLNERKEAFKKYGQWENSRRPVLQASAAAAGGAPAGGARWGDEHADSEEVDEDSEHFGHAHDDGGACQLPQHAMPAHNGAIQGSAHVVEEIFKHIVQNHDDFSEEELSVLVKAIRKLGQTWQQGAQGVGAGANVNPSGEAALAAGGTNPELAGLQQKLFIIAEPVKGKNYYAAIKGVRTENGIKQFLVSGQRISKNQNGIQVQGQVGENWLTPQELEDAYKEIPRERMTPEFVEVRNRLTGRPAKAKPLVEAGGVTKVEVIRSNVEHVEEQIQEAGPEPRKVERATTQIRSRAKRSELGKVTPPPLSASENADAGLPVETPKLTAADALRQIDSSLSALAVKSEMQKLGFQMTKNHGSDFRDPSNWVLANPVGVPPKVTSSSLNSNTMTLLAGLEDAEAAGSTPTQPSGTPAQPSGASGNPLPPAGLKARLDSQNHAKRRFRNIQMVAKVRLEDVNRLMDALQLARKLESDTWQGREVRELGRDIAKLLGGVIPSKSEGLAKAAEFDVQKLFASPTELGNFLNELAKGFTVEKIPLKEQGKLEGQADQLKKKLDELVLKQKKNLDLQNLQKLLAARPNPDSNSFARGALPIQLSNMQTAKWREKVCSMLKEVDKAFGELGITDERSKVLKKFLKLEDVRIGATIVE